MDSEQFSQLLQQQSKVHGEQIQQLLNLQQTNQEKEQHQVTTLTRHEQTTIGSYDRFRATNPPTFAGGTNLAVGEEQIIALESIFSSLHTGDADRVSCVNFLLIGHARIQCDCKSVSIYMRTFLLDRLMCLEGGRMNKHLVKKKLFLKHLGY